MPNIVLRDVHNDDLSTLHEHQSDAQACQMAAFKPRAREAFFAHWKTILANPGVLARTVLLDGRVVGYVKSFGPTEDRQVAYWIDRALWGQGVASAALDAFRDVDTTRPLWGTVAAHNVGSIRVLEKCGFVKSGERPAEPDERGPGVDEVILVLQGD